MEDVKGRNVPPLLHDDEQELKIIEWLILLLLLIYRIHELNMLRDKVQKTSIGHSVRLLVVRVRFGIDTAQCVISRPS